MTVYLEEEGSLTLPLPARSLAAEAAEAALDEIGCPYEAEVNLLLTMNEQIREMNREYRNIDRATDVLSFPMIEYEDAGVFDFLEDEPDCFDPETGRLLLGDIVISKEKVFSQAKEYGHTLKREFAFLVVHSILHLSGYDHMEEEERKTMEALQDKILEKLDILR